MTGTNSIDQTALDAFGDFPDFSTPPPLEPDTGSPVSSRRSAAFSLSPLTPQRRLGEPIVEEVPFTPTSLSHQNYVRQKINEITAHLEEQGAKVGVVLYSLQDHMMRFQEGSPY
ncbi:hypothetical protein LTR62_004568 [Meristemomyces frigidus]|uniref:Uncharacterized protein n=1 Tax=Meristemomyces frigidus TaxID=1508187 RepID=A0AAN7TFF3_9PEZI|nr:hypothetical protein LTR62_004568 [Meristemomyces frigidus]